METQVPISTKLNRLAGLIEGQGTPTDQDKDDSIPSLPTKEYVFQSIKFAELKQSPVLKKRKLGPPPPQNEDQSLPIQEWKDELLQFTANTLNGSKCLKPLQYYNSICTFLCRSGYTKEVSKELIQLIEGYFTEVLLPELKEEILSDGENAIQHLVDAWNIWYTKTRRIHFVVIFLNQLYLLNSSSRQSIDVLATKLFVENLLELEGHEGDGELMLFDQSQKPTRLKILLNLLEWIKELKTTGNLTNQDLYNEFKEIIKTFEIDNKIKLKNVLPDMIRVCDEQLKNKWLGDEKLAKDYVTKVQNSMLISQDLAKEWDAKFEEIRQREIHFFVVDPIYRITQELVPSLFYQDIDSIEFLMFCIQDNPNNYRLILEAFGGIVKGQLEDCFNSDSTPTENYILEPNNIFVTWNQKLENRISYVELETQLEKAITDSLNSHQEKVIRALLSFIESNMKKRSRSDYLELVSFIFTKLKNKTAFLKQYQNQMSKRLLYNSSIQFEDEESIIDNLKTDDVTTEISPLVSMIQDIKNSSKLTSSVTNDTSIEMDYKIIRDLSWPKVPLDYDVRLPQYLLSVLDNPELQEKVVKKNMVRYKWCNFLHRLEIETSFKGEVKTLVVNGYYAAIFLAFNDSESLTLAQLTKLTKLEKQYLIECLKVLCFGKYKLLLRNNQSQPFKNTPFRDDDVFSINSNFTDRSKKLFIKPAKGFKTDEVITSNYYDAQKETTNRINAFIVRTMKLQRRCSHSKLLADILSFLKEYNISLPKVTIVKECIEELIKQGFLKRDASGSSYYYVP
ncbi:BA75_04175T0 [Komagataella pastoris]|uniref:BA75_04175T0 n=1 Tax=Komagataella pastoris TaxID=4922 RepID=A0A1B2JEJ6_PICPA|nr:BA75_04175T0 [Komagataella pastoris]